MDNYTRLTEIEIIDYETAFRKSVLWVKHYYKIYKNPYIEYDDYFQECALKFWGKLCKIYCPEVAWCVSKSTYKQLFFDLLVRRLRGGFALIFEVFSVGYNEKEIDFIINDITKDKYEKDILKKIYYGYSYKELHLTKRQIIYFRKLVGKYFGITPNATNHRNYKFSEKTCEDRKERYKIQKDKLLECAIKHNQRPVNAILNGEVVKTFDSIKAGALWCNGNPSSITKSIKRKFKTKGYNWEYAEE